MSAAPIVELDALSIVRDGVTILDRVSWRVLAGERWVVLGPNGAGKTTLVQVITAYAHPTRGSATVLGQALGRVDVRELRKRIAVATGAITRTLDPRLTARQIVQTGRHASLAPWWDSASDAAAAEEVDALLASAGLTAAADRPFSALSEGERQRALLARMRMARAELWVFDEPAAGLDLGARERLIADLDVLAAGPEATTTLFVTHHIEEIPPSFTHALLLREGKMVAAGPLDETLSAATLGTAFNLELVVDRVDGRWWARGVSGRDAPAAAGR